MGFFRSKGFKVKSFMILMNTNEWHCMETNDDCDIEVEEMSFRLDGCGEQDC
mgnify:CR=1 FL=1